MWIQTSFRMQPVPRGSHLITKQVLQKVPEIGRVRIGMMNLFLKHTSAALTVNENADPDVRADMETVLNLIVPEKQPFRHTSEGRDDMPAHVKASLFGASLSIPVRDGQLDLGTWQGIWLCEFRDRATAREIVITIHGE